MTDLLGKLAAAAILLAVVVILIAAALKERAPQPYMPVVNAAGCEALQNPCDLVDCYSTSPRGGTDPDAGERDQRRIA